MTMRLKLQSETVLNGDENLVSASLAASDNPRLVISPPRLITSLGESVLLPEPQ
jgi:hypothetical protein